MQPSYTDGLQRRRRASDDAVVAVLRALGAPLDDAAGAPAALAEERRRLESVVVDPVVVAWEGEEASAIVRVQRRRVACTLIAENGAERSWTATAEPSEEAGTSRIALPRDIDRGYHRLRVEAGGAEGEALVIAAPARAWSDTPPTWGLFAPVYSIRSARDWGAGDLTDLGDLIESVGRLGGGVVATLPLYAAFLDEPFEPSPYSPASRLFFGELWADLDRAPQASDPAVRRFLSSPAFRKRREALRRAELVDYRGLAALKREALDRLAAAADPAALRSFARANPEARDYARFRGAVERLGPRWSEWPAKARDGKLGPADTDPAAERRHLYAQWLLSTQLGELRARADAADAGLYLDLPLGVHPDGYDTWRHREAFATGAAGGAPPDSFFTAGQNWSFPPMHPGRVREGAYRYPIAVLRAALAHATVLRIDHVMGLHRLFFIPDGFEAADGMYVRSRPDEWYAILAVESHRHRALIVGEDLGTVPAAVRSTMSRRGVLRSYIVQEETTDDAFTPLRPVPKQSLASPNTHDMPTWRAFWDGLDVRSRLSMGLLDEAGAKREAATRARRTRAIERMLRRAGHLPAGRGRRSAAEALDGTLRWLAASPSRVTIVSLDDLLGEAEGHNVPGSGDEHPNWRRKSKTTVEALESDPAVLSPLASTVREEARP